MKAFLQTVATQNVFQLAPKITTIGRGGCDLTIETPGVDCQHATIEYLQDRSSFVLKDLNSSHGTFVNSCRVQNAAICLSDGDLIRFGCNMATYKFKLHSSHIDHQLLQLRKTWGTSSDAILEATTGNYRSENILPAVFPVKLQSSSLPTSAMSMRTRPFSGGFEASGQIPYGDKPIPIPPPLNSNLTFSNTGLQNGSNIDSATLTLIVKDLTQKVKDKEILVQRLRSEVQDLQMHIRQTQTKTQRPKVPLDASKLSNIIQRNAENDSKPSASTQINIQLQEINGLRSELERVQKDKNITSGLITQMQRDMSNKDSTISRLTREIENLKATLKEKDLLISVVQSKITSPVAQNPEAEELEVKEKELAILKHKAKETEHKMQEKDAFINDLKLEIEKLKDKNLSEKKARMKLETDIENTTLQNLNYQSTEQQTRVDMEQIRKRLEMLESMQKVSEKQNKTGKKKTD